MAVKRNIFNDWLDIYNSKKNRIFRTELCCLVNIRNDDNTTYKKIISPLLQNQIISFGAVKGNRILLIINRSKLEKFIRLNINYKKVDDFIHASTTLAMTG